MILPPLPEENRQFLFGPSSDCGYTSEQMCQYALLAIKTCRDLRVIDDKDRQRLTAERDYWRAYAGSSDHFYKVMSEGLTAERDAFKIAANRYETVRKMNAKQFVELYRANIEQGMLFDDLVDNFCIATVNAMDYEYTAKARAAIAGETK